MHLRSRNPKATTVGIVGSGVSIVWRTYSAFTTAEQVPKDLKSVSGILADPGFWPWLFIVGFLLLLGWSLWPSREEPTPDAGITQTSSGPNSPNLAGTFHGPVTQNFHAPPERVETEPRRPPYGGWSDASLEGLKRAMEAGNRPSGIEGLARLVQEPEEPETPIWIAIKKIAGRIGDGDSANGFPEARRQLRQAALSGRVCLWGREQIPPLHYQDDRCRDVSIPIAQAYWKDYRIKPEAADETQPDAAHTEDEELPPRRAGRFWNLKVDLKEINQRWPKPQPPKPSTPKGTTWMGH